MKKVHGAELNAALSRGIFEGYGSMTWPQLQDACVNWSPWTRKCAILARNPERLFRCSPLAEPRLPGGYGGPSEATRKTFDDCVSAATDKDALAACAGRASPPAD